MASVFVLPSCAHVALLSFPPVYSDVYYIIFVCI